MTTLADGIRANPDVQAVMLAEVNRSIRYVGEIASIGRPPPSPIHWETGQPRPRTGAPRGQRALGTALAAVFFGTIASGQLDGLGLWLVALFVTGVLALCALWALDGIEMPARTPKVSRRLSRAQERARLIADCERQHQAFLRGDMAMATYGRFAP